MGKCHYQMYDINHPPIHNGEENIFYDTFKDIPGYEGRYQMNEQGIVRRLYKNNKAKELYPTRNHGNQVRYTLVDANGNAKAFTATRLTCLVYGITVPKGYSVIHKNGLKTENDIYNLALIKNTSITKYHKHGEIPIEKIDKTQDRIVKVYPSIKEAARIHRVGEDTMERWIANPNTKDKQGILNQFTFKKRIIKDRAYKNQKEVHYGK